MAMYSRPSSATTAVGCFVMNSRTTRSSISGGIGARRFCPRADVSQIIGVAGGGVSPPHPHRAPGGVPPPHHPPPAPFPGGPETELGPRAPEKETRPAPRAKPRPRGHRAPDRDDQEGGREEEVHEASPHQLEPEEVLSDE